MSSNFKEYIPFMNWIIEIAEEKIVEHRLIKKEFNSHQEFIVFTIIWMRVYKFLYQKIKKENNLKNFDQKNLSLDNYIKNFYLNQKDKYLGMTINSITRECQIPRSTVKRIIERLIIKGLVNRNSKDLIIPTSKVRDKMSEYRKYIIKSNKKNNKLFNSINLHNNFKD